MSRKAERWLLGLAAVAVAFAAADTYVVVLALPDMMITVGLGVDELQRAAPIVSGFLLGYVAILPLIGRVADVKGRVPVLVASLVIFAFGSMVTALAFDLPTVVTGRFLQGAGGGGLVPATLALVADLYPAERRAVPLGVVSAVQEIGSVLGPLLGAVILSVARWEAIFWVNLAAGLVLAVAISRSRSGSEVSRWLLRKSRSDRLEVRAPGGPPPPASGRRDLVGILLLLVFLGCLVLLLWEPDALVSSVSLGIPFVPVTGDSRWLTPLAMVAVAAALLLVLRCTFARRPLVDVRDWAASIRQADPLGSALLALLLAGVVLAFASADPAVQVFSAAAPWLLAGSASAAVLLVVHLRRTEAPLVPHGALGNRSAWGSLVVSFFVGAALIAALVDVPVYARVTTYRDSQLLAALVLLRLLVAVPVGAVLGGHLTGRTSPGVVTAAGMALACLGFVWMTTWGAHSLESWVATVPLVLAGLGFGLALAPVNVALLAATDAGVHGVVTALVVVARMVGMLVGISVLTTIGLRRYFEAYRPDHELAAAIVQVQTIFAGAAGCALLAGLLALLLFGRTGVTPRSEIVVAAAH